MTNRVMVDGQTYTATFATEAEAIDWLVVTRGRMLGRRAARILAVEEYAHRWLGEFIDTAADVDRYRRDVGEHIAPALGSRPLLELIRPAEITAVLRQIAADATAAVAEQVRVTLHELFIDAVEGRLIARSPLPALWCRAQQAGIY